LKNCSLDQAATVNRRTPSRSLLGVNLPLIRSISTKCSLLSHPAFASSTSMTMSLPRTCFCLLVGFLRRCQCREYSCRAVETWADIWAVFRVNVHQVLFIGLPPKFERPRPAPFMMKLCQIMNTSLPRAVSNMLPSV